MEPSYSVFKSNFKPLYVYETSDKSHLQSSKVASLQENLGVKHGQGVKHQTHPVAKLPSNLVVDPRSRTPKASTWNSQSEFLGGSDQTAPGSVPFYRVNSLVA